MKPFKSHFTLLTLFVFAFQASCYSLSDVASLKFNTRPIMNAYASSTGEISIFKDVDGYYIYTDLAYAKTQSQMTNDTVKMMLSLSNNNLLLIDSCLNFNKYPCDYYHCTRYSGAVATINYPNFIASTIQASADAYLDYGYWDAEEQVLLATACSSYSYSTVGSRRSGVLGLGTDGNSKRNFLKTMLFSIYLKSDLQGGILKFANDQKYANGSACSLTASANWIVPTNGFVQVGGYSAGSLRGGLAFDMNADALGFPLSIFPGVVQGVVYGQWVKKVTCTTENYQPTCNYTGYIRDLPTISVSTGQTSYSDFYIPPEVYVKNARSKDDYVYSITLNIKAIDPTLTGKSYVTSDYKDTMIMDARTMSSFYIVFDASSGSNTVKMYHATTDPNGNNPPPRWWVYVILILVVVLVISAICCCAAAKRRAAKKSVTTVVVPETSQAPLIAADNSSMNYPAISSEYNYQQNFNQYPGAAVVVPEGNNGNYYQQQQQPQGVIYAPPNPPSDPYPNPNNVYREYAKQ